MKILVIEDHPALRQLLFRHLQHSGFAVDAVATGEHALLALRTNQYSGMLLDLGLPDMDGMQVLRNAAAHTRPRPPCIVLTARDSLESRLSGLNAGADDYVLKPFEMAELEARLRAVLRRAHGMPARHLGLGNLRYDPQCMQLEVDDASLTLPRREAMLLEEILRIAPRVAVKDRLEECLYASSEAASLNAVEALVSRLRRKLAQLQATVRIDTVRGVGYRMIDAGQE